MSSDLLEKGYTPHEVEKRWYAYWEAEGLFKAADKSDKPGYSIVIPPPNVTGVLHMGHALNNTMQDILCRYRRLKGDNVLWMPGTDHAGIATQNVVERKLADEGTDRHALGREKFIDKVWEWRQEYGSAIINQLKRLGASCDWERERFTMDEGLSQAVRKVFVKLYEDGLIYRGDYIINWCSRCHTALSDLEVEHEDTDGNLYHIRYPYADGSGHVVVATTRPETMLGDTAVAVHPEDARYTAVHAKRLTLPLMNREIPFVLDDYVDKAFGTGALKVTPAHDPNDFEIGRRHDLPSVKVIRDDGSMSAEAGPYEGLDRFACRKKVLADLEAQGLLEKIEPIQHAVGHCYRCQTVVEPNLSKQWFVKAKPLAQKAIAAVESGQTRIVPEMWNKTYFDWMNNIRDWCISRQIWWGHRIPAWTCEDCEELIVAMQAPEACTQCGGTRLSRETDVLDTWFSSALWPFSTMGWPEETDLLKTFYPTATLVTAFDILFFWVARMMMMGIHFMGEVPFKDVYVHALVRDEHGKKMSKSTGNVIDPLVVIDEYGTDAFRFTLAAFAAQGRDIKMSEKRVEGYRHFINKLWNAARFSLMHLDRGYEKLAAEALALPHRWIFSRLGRVTVEVETALDAYKYNEAAGAIYQFVWHEFCDWYLEAVKPALYGTLGDSAQADAKRTLWFVMRDILVLLHPFTPFVTEEIWDKLPGTEGSIMRARYPEQHSYLDRDPLDESAEAEMQLVIDVITGVRNVRGEMNLPPAKPLAASLQCEAEATAAGLAEQRDLIVNLARLTELGFITEAQKPKTAATAIVNGAVLYVDLEGVIDVGQEIARLEKEIAKAAKELAGVARKLGNEDFLAKAPPEVVAKNRDRHDSLIEKQEKLETTLGRMREME